MKAFVTGGSSGIGRAIALHLAKIGYDVAISYRSDETAAHEAVTEIEKMGRKGMAVYADLNYPSQIPIMFETYRKEFGTLDVFVNNAGVTRKASFLETTQELFDNICNVDYKSAYFCIQNAAKIMVEDQIKGSIVLISSNNAKAHFADVSVYASVKLAAIKMAEHAAIELARYGIRVNSIAPGWTDTGSARLDRKEETYYKVPLQKWAASEEIAKAVEYLSSEAASSITGITLTIDNGALLVSDKRERYGY